MLPLAMMLWRPVHLVASLVYVTTVAVLWATLGWGYAVAVAVLTIIVAWVMSEYDGERAAEHSNRSSEAEIRRIEREARDE